MRAAGIMLIAVCLLPPAATRAQSDAGTLAITTFHAEGAQVYQCQHDGAGRASWQFREPIATLIEDGKSVGRHYAGPSWELADGTLLTAKVVARSPGATENDIPWLRLSVDQVVGRGPVSQATIIRRHNTQGGSLGGACTEIGTYRSVPYSADYTFMKARNRE